MFLAATAGAESEHGAESPVVIHVTLSNQGVGFTQ